MDTTMESQPLIKSKRTLSDDPQYIGAYLNVAALILKSINNYPFFEIL